MDPTWEKTAKGLSLEAQWKALYDKTRPLRHKLKAIWKGGGFQGQKKLLGILKDLGVKSFLDCGCADFHWLSKLDWTGIDYLGVDIVPDLIEQNKEKFPDLKFACWNIVKKIPTDFDMIFIRDVFTHLQLVDGLKIIENIKSSGSRYLMASSSSKDINHDTSCLVLYPRNLRIEPFNLPDPIKKIPDKQTPGYYMGIWKIDEI